MKIENKYCTNCGAPYRIQLSGHGNYVDVPQYLQDRKYCPGCKQAIITALKPIPKVTEIQYHITTEIDIDTLLKQEEVNHQEAIEYCKQNNLFPPMRQSRMDPSAPMTGVVSIPTKYGVNYFSYSYPIGKPDEAEIKIQVRVDLKTKLIIDRYYDDGTKRN